MSMTVSPDELKRACRELAELPPLRMLRAALYSLEQGNPKLAEALARGAADKLRAEANATMLATRRDTPDGHR